MGMSGLKIERRQLRSSITPRDTVDIEFVNLNEKLKIPLYHVIISDLAKMERAGQG